MTWPGWGDVLPLLTALVTAIATVIGAVVTWARISDRTVSRAVEKAGRQSEKAVDRLYERLRTNDFHHVEERIDDTVAKIDRGLQDMGARIEGVEVRIGKRLDRAGQDRKDMEARLREDNAAMEARILAAVERRPDDTDGSESRS